MLPATARTAIATLFLLLFLAFTPLFAADSRAGFNAGYAMSVTDYDPGGAERIDALFVAFEYEWTSGLLLQFSLSSAKQDGSTFADQNQNGEIDAVTLGTESSNLRGALVAGYRWNKDGLVRPQLYGGISQIQFERKIESITFIDDSSDSFVVGAGVIVGQENHALTVDYIYDLDHEVEYEFNLGKEKFKYRELRLGWLYRW